MDFVMGCPLTADQYDLLGSQIQHNTKASKRACSCNLQRHFAINRMIRDKEPKSLTNATAIQCRKKIGLLTTFQGFKLFKNKEITKKTFLYKLP